VSREEDGERELGEAAREGQCLPKSHWPARDSQGSSLSQEGAAGSLEVIMASGQLRKEPQGGKLRSCPWGAQLLALIATSPEPTTWSYKREADSAGYWKRALRPVVSFSSRAHRVSCCNSP